VRKLRVGVVGCGAVVTLHHLPAFARARHVELVALADRDLAWARTVAQKVGVQECYDDYAKLVGRVDAVLLATPNTSHVAIGSRLLEAGLHVLCEKPMATTCADVDAMFAAAERGGARLMAAQSTRFNANVTMLKQLLAAGWLGQLETITASLGSAYDVAERRTEFRRDAGLAGGGVLMDLGIHLIDTAVWLAGRPSAVHYDAAYAPGWTLETDADVVLEFAAGGRGTFAVSYTHACDPTLTVRGSDGWASASLYVPSQLSVFSERARICRRGGMQRLTLDDRASYERQLDHFAEAILLDRPFVVQPHETRAGIEIVERCYGASAAPEIVDDAEPRSASGAT